MAGLVRKSLDSPEVDRPFEDGMGKLEVVNLEAWSCRPGYLRTGMAVVQARQAHRQDRQLPSRGHGLLRLGADEGRHGRRRGNGVRPGRLSESRHQDTTLDLRRPTVRRHRLARLSADYAKR